MTATKTTGWQKTFAPGCEQAFLGGRRYVVRRESGFYQPWDSAPWVAEENPGQWQQVCPTQAEAAAACEAHAGTSDYDPIPANWDCSGDAPNRYVG